MRQLYIWFFVVCFAHLSLYGDSAATAAPVRAHLLDRLPEWKPQVVERYTQGNPKLVIFYEERQTDQWVAIKRMQLFENGKTQEEADLIEIQQTDPGYKRWNSTIVPHGVYVEFYETGHLKNLSYYDRGLLHGTVSSHYSDGSLEQ